MHSPYKSKKDKLKYSIQIFSVNKKYEIQQLEKVNQYFQIKSQKIYCFFFLELFFQIINKKYNFQNQINQFINQINSFKNGLIFKFKQKYFRKIKFVKDKQMSLRISYDDNHYLHQGNLPELVKGDDLRSPGCNPREFESHSCQYFFNFLDLNKTKKRIFKKKISFDLTDIYFQIAKKQNKILIQLVQSIFINYNVLQYIFFIKQNVIFYFQQNLFQNKE
ncbi:hypothetical protein TTHERM_000319933 (macronuclear) [Tetrahymena thermophila SB210]|uniref:Uncharacterized protein n=1 Tax=Tetrahymena thermophila (strain SB210) TaxID=312017 RepID=W7XJ22_TETTS|nr:hypothetical protein TTHERM_000319933 [Tetrahymena thermophila SB210]EWS75141.1 hypothetical protein TTHERM_000319933 [Tetrahymena thermophila SB210]|eukprot:XP_012652297.1 hypothetical protein TTHERM_000319933 [Tetrahymena thermophila SB210]